MELGHNLNFLLALSSVCEVCTWDGNPQSQGFLGWNSTYRFEFIEEEAAMSILGKFEDNEAYNN